MLRMPFLNLWVDSFNIDELDSIKTPSQILSLNLDQIILAQDDLELRKVIEESELIIPDGAIVPLTFNFKNPEKLSKIAGIELAEHLIEKYNKVAFLGASEEVIEAIKEKFSAKLVFAHHGYFDLDRSDEIIREVLDSEPELFLVALGSPLQEKFIYKYKNLFSKTILMGLGGSFDVWSGKLKRAPKWLINLGFEWFFRIIQEPYRLKRFLYNVCRYIFLLIRK